MSTTDDDLDGEQSFWGQLDDDSPEPADWAGDELEAAYLRAIEALEASDAQFPEAAEGDPSSASNATSDATAGAEADSNSAADTTGDDTESATPVDSSAMITTPSATPHSPDRIDEAKLAIELTALSDEAARRQSSASKPAIAVTPRQILEALLFVGGEPLTTRKLVNVLRGEFTAEFIESQLDELNAQYARAGCPYEIRLGDGGYRMVLREDFERIRRKSYGLGPKEVKLSQEAIEVLAVVAYHQPLTLIAIEELGKPGSSGVLRQLLRRELIVVERSHDRPRDVFYRTTPRFLSLFGLRNLNELPRLEQVGYK